MRLKENVSVSEEENTEKRETHTKHGQERGGRSEHGIGKGVIG